jgi:hypothetical protein
MKTLILTAVASVALLSQEHAAPVLPESAPNARAIIGPSIAATDRSWRAREQYTYTERAEDRRLDSDGHVKSEDVDVSVVTFVNGIRVEELVEHNGMPPSAVEQRKYLEKVKKLKRETVAERAARVLIEQEDNASLIREVPLAFDFSLAGEDTVDGRPAWVLQATPHPGYQARGKYGKMFAKVEGKLWVDKEDFGWIKADARVVSPLSVGFLARLQPGSRIIMEQTRVSEGMWLPKHIEARASARILFIKTLVIDRVLRYSAYQPAHAGPGSPLPLQR